MATQFSPAAVAQQPAYPPQLPKQAFQPPPAPADQAFSLQQPAPTAAAQPQQPQILNFPQQPADVANFSQPTAPAPQAAPAGEPEEITLDQLMAMLGANETEMGQQKAALKFGFLNALPFTPGFTTLLCGCCCALPAIAVPALIGTAIAPGAGTLIGAGIGFAASAIPLVISTLLP